MCTGIAVTDTWYIYTWYYIQGTLIYTSKYKNILEVYFMNTRYVLLEKT